MESPTQREETYGERMVVMEHKPITDTQRTDMNRLKRKVAAVLDEVDLLEQRLGRKRGFSIAKTKLEEAGMWAVKAITNPDL